MVDIKTSEICTGKPVSYFAENWIPLYLDDVKQYGIGYKAERCGDLSVEDVVLTYVYDTWLFLAVHTIETVFYSSGSSPEMIVVSTVLGEHILYHVYLPDEYVTIIHRDYIFSQFCSRLFPT